MSEVKPLKRHPSLQPLSREHHHGLLLAWKIRTGLSEGVAAERIKTYSDWFFENHLLPHFEVEERHIFPVLGGGEHPLVNRALREHRRLKHLFAATGELVKHLSQIDEELTAHIRFEERELFNELQSIASAGQLAEIERLHHAQPFVDDWADRFWER
ncbi:MAG: hemerythrin domain-containing protein [Bacteroidota bacterium]